MAWFEFGEETSQRPCDGRKDDKQQRAVFPPEKESGFHGIARGNGLHVDASVVGEQVVGKGSESVRASEISGDREDGSHSSDGECHGGLEGMSFGEGLIAMGHAIDDPP